ncbi:DegT/DnrJ/EryC1/StrS family aminotransferase [Kitasatospora sp. NPDC093806]|uniref:DegT/DnrJ/EryC1/StrS family aminotransferase n=1 Tax=Kitasatospora sp. NPDC093806 TaxID=3155075 RepID=UPI00342DEF0D
MGISTPAPPTTFTVPYARMGSQLDEREVGIVREVMASGQTLSQGLWRDRFEEKFRHHVGTRHAYSVTSGTVALELAIHLLDLEPGDEVITTPQTYQATIQPLLNYDVTVRFADVLPASLNIDPDRVAELITPRTKAIVLVHYAGLPAQMDEIMALADRHGILVLEDAAHALGTVYRSRPAGQLGHIATFSFHSSKNITTLGEGGMITFDRDDWADRLERLRGNESDAVFVASDQTFGPFSQPPAGVLYPGRAYTHECTEFRRAGTNATLSEPAAAVGLVQLDKLPELVARRQAIAARLTEVLTRFDGIRVPEVPADVVHPYHLFTFLVEPESGIERDALLRRLGEEGVETYLRYFPLHLLPEWRAQGHGYGECPVAERLWFEQHMNLPCHPSLSMTQTEHLADALTRALTALSR